MRKFNDTRLFGKWSWTQSKYVILRHLFGRKMSRKRILGYGPHFCTPAPQKQQKSTFGEKWVLKILDEKYLNFFLKLLYRKSAEPGGDFGWKCPEIRGQSWKCRGWLKMARGRSPRAIFCQPRHFPLGRGLRAFSAEIADRRAPISDKTPGNNFFVKLTASLYLLHIKTKVKLIKPYLSGLRG